MCIPSTILPLTLLNNIYEYILKKRQNEGIVKYERTHRFTVNSSYWLPSASVVSLQHRLLSLDLSNDFSKSIKQTHCIKTGMCSRSTFSAELNIRNSFFLMLTAIWWDISGNVVKKSKKNAFTVTMKGKMTVSFLLPFR